MRQKWYLTFFNYLVKDVNSIIYRVYISRIQRYNKNHFTYKGSDNSLQLPRNQNFEIVKLICVIADCHNKTDVVISATYGVYVKALPSLSYDTVRRYVISVRCTDNKTPVTGTLTVYVTKNKPPVFQNLPGIPKPLISAILYMPGIPKSNKYT